MSARTFFASAAADGTIGLFTTDGTPGHAVQIAVPGASPHGVTPTDIMVIGSQVVFTGLDATGVSCLFAYDGVTGTAAKVAVVGNNYSRSNPASLTIAGSKLLFAEDDGAGSSVLSSYDPATGNVSQVTVAATGNEIATPDGLTVAGNNVLFGGLANGYGASLFSYDIATGRVTEVDGSGLGNNPIAGFTVAGTKALFEADDTNYPNSTSLFCYDTVSGSITRLNLLPTSRGSGQAPYDLTVAGTTVLFEDLDSANHASLFRYDTTTGNVAEVSVATASSSGLAPYDLTVVGSTVMFGGTDSAGLGGLFRYDVPSGSVEEVRIGGDYARGLDPATFTVLGSNVLIAGHDAFGKAVVFRYETVSAGAGQVGLPRPLSDALNNSTVIGGKVVFSGDDPAGSSLFSYDITSRTVAEIPAVRNAANANPLGSFTSDGIVAAFYALDPSGHVSYWQTDGTDAGTKELLSGVATPDASTGLIDISTAFAPLADATLTLATNGPADVGYDPGRSPFGVQAVTGRLASGSGAPLAGQVVTLSGNGVALSTQSPVVTDAQGAFRASVFLPGFGPVNLVASAADGFGDVASSTATTVSSHIDAPLFGTATFTPNSTAAQVYALYEAILGQAPDGATFPGMVDAVAGGRPLLSLAQQLLSSAQYTTQYGAAAGRSASDFVATLYQDGLGRAPEAGQGWTALLSSGALTEAQVALDIGVSPESIGHVQPTFGTYGASSMLSEVDSTVARIYYAVLGRAPDAGGLAFMEGLVSHGAALIDVVSDALASPEYRASFGTPSNAQFVTALYQNALGRTPEPGQGWTAMLEAGVSRSSVALGVVQSTEARVDLSQYIERGFRVA